MPLTAPSGDENLNRWYDTPKRHSVDSDSDLGLQTSNFKAGAIFDMLDFIARDSYARYLGIEITDYGPGTAKAKLVLQQHHLNSMGSVHGGAVFSLADAVFSVASNSHGGIAMAVNVSISFFKAVREGALVAEAREISLNRKLATYLIDVTDDHGNAVAMFQGTVYKKQDVSER